MSDTLMHGHKNMICAEIHNKLKANKTLLKFLYYMTNDIDIPNAKNLSIEDAIKVSKENIFIEDKSPADVSRDVKCYVCMNYGTKIYHEQSNMFFNGNTFIIRIVCHKDVRACLNGDRVYAIEEEIFNIFGDGLIGTTCRTRVASSVPISAKSSDYTGVEIQLVFKDFNGGKEYGY